MSAVACDFLAVLNEPVLGVEGNYLEVTGMRGGAPGFKKNIPRSVSVDLADPEWRTQIAEIADGFANEGENVYFGVAARTVPTGPEHPRSEDKDVSELWVLWCDADPPKQDGEIVDPNWKAKWR